jgi:hypothetical protein
MPCEENGYHAIKSIPQTGVLLETRHPRRFRSSYILGLSLRLGAAMEHP